MKYILIPFLFILQSSFAQSIYVSCIAGQYTMTDMRSTQDKLIKDYTASFGVPMESRLSFPVSLQLELGGNFQLSNRNSLGFFGSYANTKGQLGYSDFSGEVESQQDVSRFFLGGKYTLNLNRHFSFYTKVGYVTSTLVFDEHLTIGGVIVSSNHKGFHSKGFSLEPGLQYSYNTSDFTLKLFGGYELNFQGTTWLDTDSNAYLLKPSGGKAIIDWTGYRIGFAVEYKIKAK
jgi:hypothetical protein